MIFIGQNPKGQAVQLHPEMANRHGLIAGATGTGKTITMQVLAENFSDLGVPVFMVDVKGDVSGMAQAGQVHPRIAERVKRMQLEPFRFQSYPTLFWDIFAEQGHPVRTTISEMGPLLLSRLLNLNETQSGVLSLVFRVADDNGWLLLDLKDLRVMLRFVAEHAKEFRTVYGNVSAASVGAIQRRLMELENQGGDKLFSEPALNLDDLLQTDDQGKGVVSLLDARKLIHAPQIYSTFLLWLLSELYEQLPEVGDPDKPELMLFFDEAHLMFKRAPAIVLDKIEQVVRLIRSKGVGLFFITQNPTDIPETVLGQLGNRIQHALRAYTVRDQKAVRAAAETFRANPELDTETVITELGVGEALVSVLDNRGRPGRVERTLIKPPQSQIGPISGLQRQQLIRHSNVAGVYDKTIDRESAFEILAKRAARRTGEHDNKDSSTSHSAPRSGHQRQSVLDVFLKSAMRSIGGQIGRKLTRGLLGSLLGK